MTAINISKLAARKETILGSGHSGGSTILLNQFGMVEWRGGAGTFVSHSSPEVNLAYWDNPSQYASEEARREMAVLASNLRAALSLEDAVK